MIGAQAIRPQFDRGGSFRLERPGGAPSGGAPGRFRVPAPPVVTTDSGGPTRLTLATSPTMCNLRTDNSHVPGVAGWDHESPTTAEMSPSYSAGSDYVRVVPEPSIHARGLRKSFGEFTAVDGIDVDVAPGEAFGFLGPNGAGKSSTMRMIGCVSPSTGGTLRIFGLDPATHGPQIRRRLGVVPQLDTLDSELTVKENLVIYGRYFDLSYKQARARADELLEFVQLSDRAGSQVEPLSGGMKRRLTIARSLVNRPELLLLDEPTTGLDPQARHVVWDRLYRLKQEGVTLVLTTHYMDEAEQLCDRLVVMDGGRIVAEGSPRSLITDHSTREVLELRYSAGTNAEQSANLIGIGDRQELLPDRVLIYADSGESALSEVHRRGAEPESALVRRSSLEDVFLHLTGRSLVD
jgi:lipooligosaccharide transport system ATP-binding protein